MMDARAPLPPVRNESPTWDHAAELARRWQLDQLAKRLDALARGNAQRGDVPR
jgi:hypothetical protein